MKHFLKRSTMLVLALTVGAVAVTAENPSDLFITCGDQNVSFNWDNDHDDLNCHEGMVTFRGKNYPDNISLLVLSYPAGTLIDSAVYSTTNGRLRFTQTLVPYGGYQLIVYQNIAGVQGDLISTKNIVVDPLD